MQFRPGQWLDVYIRGLPHAGGFTITSSPQDAEPSVDPTPQDGYLELAVQKSPRNPPAVWLWRPESEILGSDLLVRVGGSFVWPPSKIDVQNIKRVVFVAGGVGIKYSCLSSDRLNRLLMQETLLALSCPSSPISMTTLPNFPHRSDSFTQLAFPLPSISTKFFSSSAYLQS